jgi:hypothetical protein
MPPFTPASTRRTFLTAAAAILPVRGSSAQAGRYLVEVERNPSFLRKLAERELVRGLQSLGVPGEVRLSAAGERSRRGDHIFQLRLSPGRFDNHEAYSIRAEQTTITMTAAADIGLLYAVFDFLEHQGLFSALTARVIPSSPYRRSCCRSPGRSGTRRRDSRCVA